MLNKLQKRRSEGFTIIEVMIVLAIAGLIILIVLLAVPALQRNARNAAMKNDASATTAAIAEFESNNDGSVPQTVGGVKAVAGTNGLVTVSGANGTTPTSGKVQGGTIVTTVTSLPPAPTSGAPSPAIGTIDAYVGFKCEDGTGAFTPGTAGLVSSRSIAVYYTIESSGITQQKCIDG